MTLVRIWIKLGIQTRPRTLLVALLQGAKALWPVQIDTFHQACQERMLGEQGGLKRGKFYV